MATWVLAMGHLNNLECRVNDNELCAVILIIKLRSQLCVLYAHGPTLQRLGGLLGTSAERLFALCTRAINVFRMKIPEFSSNLFFG